MLIVKKENEKMNNEKFRKVAKRVAKVAAGASATVEVMMMNAMMAMAVNIDTGYSLSQNIGDTNPEQLIIGLAMWIARLIGTGMLIWGIYGYVTARKDGEAESMNGALGKLISGLVLICMPSVLKGLKILA